MIAKPPATPFASVVDVLAYAHAHGLRSVSSLIIQFPTADLPAVVAVTVRIFDNSFSAHGQGRDVERAESAALLRALAFGLGVSTAIGNGTEAKS